MKFKVLVPFRVSFPMILDDPFLPQNAKMKEKTSTTGMSDDFLHLRVTTVNTRREVEQFGYFLFFLAADLVDLGPEFLNCSSVPNLTLH